MFWKISATIDTGDEEWQLETWRWLLDHFGGLEGLRAYPLLFPSHGDFPKSGLSGKAHAGFVLSQVAEKLGIDPAPFELIEQEPDIDPVAAPLAVVQNVPSGPAGTYSAQGNRHRITVSPRQVADLEQLIATLAHEICHPIFFSVPEPPPGGEELEEFATDLAVAFFGFGIFGGNGSFNFQQFRDDGTGTQGWSVQRLGYLTQNEWGYALAVRAHLTGEDIAPIKDHANDGLWLNTKKNFRYLEKNTDKLEPLRS